jgi:hypothetical protein
MDKSTLSRDVEVLIRKGWLVVDDSADRKARPLKFSAGGHVLLEAVVPTCRQAQEKARAILGGEAADALVQVVGRM